MPCKLSCPTPVREGGHDFDQLIAGVAAGRRDPGRAWHQLRNARPPLKVWHQFAVASGRYDAKWAKHQHKCWTELSDEGTYPQQREKWLAIQAKFAADMERRHERVRTRAQLRRLIAKPAPCDQQLSLELS
ncbi:hypothetical protein MITS9509_03486 [Synechococcus sp. MIT S9509]|uniref:hypothetical protein n=1 Tax=Synechococcus sp. MIT S9509 TaxID=1801630 RepID=UPI0007BB2A2E|nr:hypothetical protein [Synechococcus sp. MIT S9509]KZR86247.1 hypothetical protein MITS9509_03486 [Synechococcus sp. MIT S9509]